MMHGVDVSHHQHPHAIDWDRLVVSGDLSWCYVRSSYGVNPDTACQTHTRGAAAAGMRVGLYHFVRQVVTAEAQLSVLRDQVASARENLTLVPCLDVESNEKFDGPLDASKLRSIVEEMGGALLDEHSSLCIYTTQRFWRRIGNPELLADPRVSLWVAHWGVDEPATPLDLPWSMWQVGTRRLDGYTGPIDYNESRVLPEMQPPTADPTVDSNRVLGHVALSLDEARRRFFAGLQ